MTFRQRLVRQPQSIWARKALFQVHLWTGVGVGLYILAISVTGSGVVFRRELAKILLPPTKVAPSGRRMSVEELTAVIRKANPRFEVTRVWPAGKVDTAVEVWMTRGGRRRERLFDPYTGKDLGDALPYEPRLVVWLVEFHDNLLGGRTGRLVNGMGAVFLTMLCVTGAIIWWPGAGRWRQSMIVRSKVGWRRFNWDLHSALGFWMFAFVAMWAVSGIYLAFPEPFTTLVDFLQPLDAASRMPRFGDDALAWLARIHFGRAWGPWVKTLWVILGFMPAALFVTGALMWWNRVLRYAFASTTSAEVVRHAAPGRPPAEEPVSP
jgi:uncharacterized iron-regulated membrane protein